MFQDDDNNVVAAASSALLGENKDDDSVRDDVFVEGSQMWSLLVVGYSLVFLVGVLANTFLLAALCGTGSRSRALPIRNHLMINLAAADLLVTGICVPISACAAASHSCWPNFMVSWMCQLGPVLQKTPVTVSTLSLALLSLDRWAAIRHPRFAQRFRESSFLLMSITMTWLLASSLAAPAFWGYQLERDKTTENMASYQETADEGENTVTNSSSWRQAASGVCVDRWANLVIQLTYLTTYLGTTFVLPALIVAFCHASVSYKLAKQLQVLAKATENRKTEVTGTKPKQVLIVARDASNNIIPDPFNPPGKFDNMMEKENVTLGKSVYSATRKESNLLSAHHDGLQKWSQQSRRLSKLITHDPNDDDDDDPYVRMQIQADLESFRQLSQVHQSQPSFHGNPTTHSSKNTNSSVEGIRAARREKSIIQANKKLRKKLASESSSASHHGLHVNKAIPIPLPTYSSHSFVSRRRAANLLAALAGVFVFCWAPYVCCAVCELLVNNKSFVRILIPFALLLGHAHSAINPVVSWRLNRSAFVRFQQHNFLQCIRSSASNCCRCCLFCVRNPCKCRCIHIRAFSGSTSGGSPTHLGNTMRLQHIQRPSANTNNRFLTVPNQMSVQNRRILSRQLQQQYEAQVSSETSCGCFRSISNEFESTRINRQQQQHQDDREGIPCCCCFCPASGPFGRRSSSPDPWNWNNSSTNEAGLGAFHPKYLNRLPVVEPDQISKCHTSHFLQ